MWASTGVRESSFGTCSSFVPSSGAPETFLRPIESSWAVRESRSQRSSFSRISRTTRYEPPRAHSCVSAPVKISSWRSTPMFCEPSAKPSRPRASATPSRLRVEGLSSAKRWKQVCAQRPSSRPLVRRMMSRTAWWVIIAWSDWASTQQVAVGPAIVEVVARERGHAAERLGPLRREPEAVVEQRRPERDRDRQAAVVAVAEAELAGVRGRQRRVRERVEPVRVALRDLGDARGQVLEQLRQVVRDHVERRNHPVGRSRRDDPGLARPLPGQQVGPGVVAAVEQAAGANGTGRHGRASRGPCYQPSA